MQTGGSVSNSAFSLAAKMGFGNIILIGQDLAYSGGKIHADATYHDKTENVMPSGIEYYEVEGVDGSTVLAPRDMNDYRIWFEEQIRDIPSVHVVDATEGGALIHGAETITLKEAIEKYCDGHPDYNFREKLEIVPPYLDADEQKAFEALINNTESRVESLREELKIGIAEYEKAGQLKKQGLDDSIEFRKCIENVTKINEHLDASLEKDMLELYDMGLSSRIEEMAMTTQKDADAEWEDLVSVGIEMYNYYIRAIDMFLQNYSEYRRTE